MAEEVVTWIDPTGIETVLPVEWDVDGRFSLASDFITDKIPGHPGETVRSVRHSVRPVSMPLWVTGVDDVALRSNLRDLVYKLDPVRGPGRLRVTHGTASRELHSYAQISAPEQLGSTSGPTVQRLSVTFTAYQNPYWSDTNPTIREFQITNTPSFFPFFPLNLTSSELLVSDYLANPGDLPLFPIWTVTGPGSQIHLKNTSSGETLSLTGAGGLSLGYGEQVIIDTRAGKKTVTKNDGTNLFRHLSLDSTFWSVAKGSNTIRLEMSGAVPTDSGLKVEYTPRYLSP